LCITAKLSGRSLSWVIRYRPIQRHAQTMSAPSPIIATVPAVPPNCRDVPNSDITGRMGPRDFRGTGNMEYQPSYGSLQLDVGCPDHFGPFFGLISNQLAEIRGRTAKDTAAEVGDACL
jgi:hypothetical protein